nr:mitogen-activated protein kinase kinase kinase 2-like [Physcomitrium patens]|eukprot:XP_024400358.1 mitogen-activated protein kinase kinase kinase 2-like [Physcomitrella patens]
MAPEVVNPKMQYNCLADIWSLGCTVLEMATGNEPFGELVCHSVFWKVGNGESPLIPEDFEYEMKDFISKCLEVTVANRPTCDMLQTHPFITGEPMTGPLKLTEGYLIESQRHGKTGYSLAKIPARLKNIVTIIDSTASFACAPHLFSSLNRASCAGAQWFEQPLSAKVGSLRPVGNEAEGHETAEEIPFLEWVWAVVHSDTSRLVGAAKDAHWSDHRREDLVETILSPRQYLAWRPSNSTQLNRLVRAI